MFQCPEGRYSSALPDWKPLSIYDVIKFQCPEGRYSSTLLRIAGVTSKVIYDL